MVISLREGDREEVVFNMVNAMLLRIHQSGHLAELTQERRDLVKEALDIYKNYSKKISKNSVSDLANWIIAVS